MHVGTRSIRLYSQTLSGSACIFVVCTLMTFTFFVVVDIGRAVVSENTGLSSLKKLDPSPSDAWEAEADELLAWTDGLNAERMMAS